MTVNLFFIGKVTYAASEFWTHDLTFYQHFWEEKVSFEPRVIGFYGCEPLEII